MKIEMRIIYNYIYNNIRILSIMISILYSQAYRYTDRIRHVLFQLSLFLAVYTLFILH